MKFPRHIPAIACLALSSFGNLVSTGAVEEMPVEHILSIQKALQEDIDSLTSKASEFLRPILNKKNSEDAVSILLSKVQLSERMRFQKLELEDPIKHDIVGPDKLTQAGFCLEEITIYAAPNLLKQEWMKTPLKIACMHPSKTIMYLDIEAYRKLDDEKRLYVLALAKGEQLTRPITDLYRVYLQLYRQFTQLRKLERSAVLKYSSTLRSLRCTHYILPFRYASNLLGNTSFAIRDIKERIKFFKTHAPVRQETDALELILYYALLSLTGNAK